MKVTLEFDASGALMEITFGPKCHSEKLAGFLADATRDAADIAADFERGDTDTPLTDAYDYMAASTQDMHESARMEELAERAAFDDTAEELKRGQAAARYFDAPFPTPNLG